jgi:hypothetical protein
VRKRVVEDAADQKWIDDAEAGRQEDQPEQAAQAQAIWEKQPADAAQRDGRVGDVTRLQLRALLVASLARASFGERLAAHQTSPSRTTASHTACSVSAATVAACAPGRGRIV